MYRGACHIVFLLGLAFLLNPLFGDHEDQFVLSLIRVKISSGACLLLAASPALSSLC